MKTGAASPAGARRMLLALASLRLTPFALLLLGAASVALYRFDQSASAWLAGPLLLLALNLAAAVATNGAFRRQLPLLVFHLALIGVVLLGAAGRLTYLQGRAELAEGAAFSALDQVEAGPLHRGRLDLLAFVNEGFEIDYAPGPVLDRNVNRVRWRDRQGRERRAAIEDNAPLLLAGYRIYPTSNKGFAPLLAWTPARAEPVLATLHLPSYPANADSQARTWRPSGASADLWIMLKIDEVLIAPDRPSRFRLPERPTLVVRREGARWELQPGERLALPDGVLEYRALRTWMGYKVSYDWTIPWLLAACSVAIVSMGWHFWRKFGAAPWNMEE